MIAEDVKLDRKRSFGTVYGDPNIGFVQDNKNFRCDGTLVPEVPKGLLPIGTAVEPPKIATVDEVQSATEAAINANRSAAQKKAWEDRKFKRTSELENGTSSTTDVA